MFIYLYLFEASDGYVEVDARALKTPEKEA